MMRAAKRRENVRCLAELRQSEPDPPMRSCLDCAQQQAPAAEPCLDLAVEGPSVTGQECRQCKRLHLQLKHAVRRVNVLEERLRAATASASAVCPKKFSRATRTGTQPTKMGMHSLTVCDALGHQDTHASCLFVSQSRSWIAGFITWAGRRPNSVKMPSKRSAMPGSGCSLWRAALCQTCVLTS